MPYRKTERTERVHEAMRRRILKAARKLFAKRGFEATTMKDIVETAGTSIGNVYFYFENKADILRILLEGALTESWALGDAAMVKTPPGPRRLALMAYGAAVGLLAHHRDLTQLIAGGETNAPVQARLVDLNTPRLRANLRESFPSYPADRLELAVAAWSGAARYVVRLCASEDNDLAPTEVAAFFARWNLRGLGVPERDVEDAIAYADAAFAQAAAS